MKYEKYRNNISLKNKVLRLLWNLVWLFLFRPFSLPFFNRWRVFLLRSFGAKIGKGCKIHASVKFWAPWNIEMGDLVAFGFDAICYNPGKIVIGSKVSISQRAHLCSASHDISDEKNPLITAPIVIKDRAWVATDTFIGMGVTINKGSVIGAKSAVFKDVAAWTVVGGNPAKVLKERKIIK